MAVLEVGTEVGIMAMVLVTAREISQQPSRRSRRARTNLTLVSLAYPPTTPVPTPLMKFSWEMI